MHRVIEHGFAAGLVVCAAGAVTSGCLTRPVDNRNPTLGTTFTSVIPSAAIDKIDILFDIDNSASMGDKQDYLRSAIPDLVNRFVNPNCVDTTTLIVTGPSNNGACPSGQKPEFPPVHDLHLGIVSSSLGMRGGDSCGPSTPAQPPYQSVPAHDDDRAHLLNRTLSLGDAGATEGTVGDAPPADPYLYWFPPGPNAGKTPAGSAPPIADAGALVSDFAEVVAGTGVFGCGVESQLESWYRFLVQPDPYDSIVVKDGAASWSGVDATILKERHDFLRPDSLVLVVVLSDENDSEIDVRSLAGQGYNWMNSAFPLPRGTSACDTDPASPACQSCAQGTNAASDPTCIATPRYTDGHDWGFDLNLRHVHMKAKYGVDPQYPIARYVNGLKSTRVPDRDGEYPPGATSYVGTNDCQNPLFASELPTGDDLGVDALCHAPPGTRTEDHVFYAHIGGVPHELLHFKAGDPTASALTPDDWTKILGTDPEHFDYRGIDPHMIESFQPRPGLPPPGSASTDPITGHEWITNQGDGHVMPVDRQYACTFGLVDSTGKATSRDCTQLENHGFCDCPTTPVTAEELPPICDPGTQSRQTGAKAYPTVRELLLAKKMGAQGIVSSICPIDVNDDATHSDPNYGYRPAVAVIVDRLKDALNDQCLPQALQGSSAGGVSCLVLLQIPKGAAGTGGTCLAPVCPASAGLTVPNADVLGRFCQGLEDQYQSQLARSGGAAEGLVDPAGVPVCALQQLTQAAFPNDFPGGSCHTESTDKGWCYLTGAAAGTCPQAVVFSDGALPVDSLANLQCDEQTVTIAGAASH